MPEIDGIKPDSSIIGQDVPLVSEADKISTKPKGKKNNTVKMLAISFAAVLLVAVIMQTFGSTMTGHVISEYNKVNVREMAYNDSQYLISSTDNTTIPMTSAKVSGTIIGNGTVRVFLESKGKRKLIYTNIKETSLPLITGFAVKTIKQEELGKGSHLTAVLDNVKITGKNNNIIAGLQLQCRGNPEGMYIEMMTASWEPDNGEKIYGIMFNGLEFWGYDKAGLPQGKQASGTLLKGWGQKMPNEAVRNIDAIELDSSVIDKKILLEVHFYDYLAGFRLGQERVLKIHIDLSGKTESYIEEDGQVKQTLILERVGPVGTTPGTETPGQETIPETQEQNPIITNETSSGNANETMPVFNNPIVEEAVTTYKTFGYEVQVLPDGKIAKTRELPREEVSFTDGTNRTIQVQVIENPEARKAFEERNTDSDTVTEISDVCKETCVVDATLLNEYRFVFEMDDNVALNVTNIGFS